MKKVAVLITGLDWPPGSTKDSFRPMAAELEKLGYQPLFGSWDNPPLTSLLWEFEERVVIGHSFGGHQAIKMCEEARPVKINGLCILDAVHQVASWRQPFMRDFAIPINVVSPLSIKRTPLFVPWSKGFDQTGFNRTLEIGHAEFPTHPAVIDMIARWLSKLPIASL